MSMTTPIAIARSRCSGASGAKHSRSTFSPLCRPANGRGDCSAPLSSSRRLQTCSAERLFATLSSAERQRLLLAGTLFAEPGVFLLDEPTAALDLAGREQLVGN